MKLVVFDLDGTLIDSEPQIYEAKRRAFSAICLPSPDRDTCRRAIGLTLPAAFAKLVGDEGPVADLIMAYKNARSDLRAEGNFEMPFPGTNELLSTLQGWPGFRLGVATGKPRNGVIQTFDRLGWDRMFSTIQTADDGPSKPAPDILLRAMHDLEMPAFKTIMVGDTTFDAEMARRARVEFIGVSWGNHTPSELLAAGAKSIASDFDDLAVRLHAFLARG